MSVIAILRHIYKYKPVCYKSIGSYNFYSQIVKDPLIDYDTQVKEVRKKTKIIPKITLLSGETLSITTLDEAQKISKRRDLKLVKIIDLDTKTQRPVYKLMTGKEFHVEDLKQRELRKEERKNGAIKGEKVLMLSDGIDEHDLNIHLNKILKWLKKNYEIKVFINNSGADLEKAEKIYLHMEKSLSDSGRILQKRTKGSDIRFQVIPPKKDKEDNPDIKL